MIKDGADSPLSPPVSAPAPKPVATTEGDDSTTLARSTAPAPLPPRPRPQMPKIRPTASLPRGSITGMAAQRSPPSMTSIPIVSPLGSSIVSLVDEADDAPDAITNHREPTVALPDASVTVDASTPMPASRPTSEPRQASSKDEPTATALVQGDVIGGLCRIDERLAISEMSVLYRAFHLQLERMVVVKVLQDAGVENPEAVARFRREARLMSLVTSEHVAKVLDVGSHDGCPFIVMERLEGADLAYLLRQVGGRLSLKQASDLVLQICEALAVAHSHGIVHRDLKPANVFVSVRAGGDLRVTIIDFGIAKAFFESTDTEDQLTKVNGLLGSPRYMAPEQVEPRLEIDERADIWALGILFQEMLTGERVFKAADGIVPLLIAIVESAPVPLRTYLPDAPDAIVATIAGALEKDPTRRLPNALTFAARVAPFASPDALQRVANIAAIAASAVERAAESRPAMSQRVTSAPPTPRLGQSTQERATVAPPSPHGGGAALASSNPPPTMRLPREVVLAEQAASAPTPLVPPPPPPPPLPPALAAAFAAFAAVPETPRVPPSTPEPGPPAAVIAPEPAPAAAPLADGQAPVGVAHAVDADDAAAVAAMRRSALRWPVVLAVAVAAMAAAVTVAVLFGRSASGEPPAIPSALPVSAPPTTPAPATPLTVMPASAAEEQAATVIPAAAPFPSAGAEPREAGLETHAEAPDASGPTTTAASPASSARSGTAAFASAAASAVAPASPKAPAATGTGKLTVVCLPKCDRVLDNGAVLGNGYVFGQDVPAGHHTLTLSTAAGARKTLSVDVPTDGVKDVRVSMER